MLKPNSDTTIGLRRMVHFKIPDPFLYQKKSKRFFASTYISDHEGCDFSLPGKLNWMLI